MIYRVAADAVLLVHLAFVLFVALGGALVLRWPRLMWLHVPCAAWGAFIALTGGICPLTPLENELRMASGAEGYSGGFIEHYILPLLYPAGLTRPIQIGLGVGALLVNLLFYGLLIRRRRRARRGG